MQEVLKMMGKKSIASPGHSRVGLYPSISLSTHYEEPSGLGVEGEEKCSYFDAVPLFLVVQHLFWMLNSFLLLLSKAKQKAN